MYGPEMRDSYITAPQTPLSVPQLTPPGSTKRMFFTRADSENELGGANFGSKWMRV